MIRLTTEYLSILQYLLYKAQKQQKIKQVLKLKQIFYKSQSLHLFILRYKLLNSFEKNKFRGYLFEPIFKKLLQISTLKKRLQINNNFLNSKLELKKNAANFLENWQHFSFSIFFLDSMKKQIFPVNLESVHWIIQLSYLSFSSNYVGLHFNIVPLINLQYIFLNEFYYSILLLLSIPKMLLFDISKKKIYINIKKNKIFVSLKSIPFIIYSLFNYQLFYYFYFYHHNYFRDIKKNQHQNSFYFDLLSNKKYPFLFDNKSNKKIIKNFENNKYGIFKNKNFCFYSIICNFPCFNFRQNACFFTNALLSNLFLKSFKNKWFLERKLNPIQKQIFLLIFEPIWEAFFEISSYSNRPGRSLFDAIEFVRLNLKKQPMFLFKIYLNFFYKTIYNYKEKKRNSTKLVDSHLQRKFVFTDNKFQITVSLFLSFFDNIIFYGIQKNFQNYYLRIKQQIFLYQILKIIKQNKKKNEYNFYKMFYNKIFVILVIQNKIKDKLENKISINKYFTININFRNYVKNLKQFIIEYCKNSSFNKYQNKMSEQSAMEQYSIFQKIRKILLKNYLIKNYLIFSLNNFFFEKIKNLKKKLFSIELNKLFFKFYLQKCISAFYSINVEQSQSKVNGLSFSIIFKDSNFFVSKNTFLFYFIKKKKYKFLQLLNQWSNIKFVFLKKIKKYKYNQFYNQKELIKVYLAQYNYKILLNIHFYLMCCYFNSLNIFLDSDSFYNIFLKFLLFIQNGFICSHLLNKKFLFNNFYLIMYYCNFYGKFYSFFKYWFKTIFLFFLLEKNDVQFIWKIFIKYENTIFVFNSNLNFLLNFEIILKKWIILNESFLFLYTKNNKKCPIKVLFNIFLYPASFLFNQYDWLIISLLSFLNEKILDNEIQKKIRNQKYIFLNTLWSIKSFQTKQKHSFYFYKKNYNGFSFFDFFLFHTNKNNKKFISNYLFFWLLYFIQILTNFKYIESFRNYYQILHLINQKRWKNKQIKKILMLRLAPLNSLYLSFGLFFQYSHYIKQFQNLIFFNHNKICSFQLFTLIFNKLLTNDYSFVIYNKLIQQKKCGIYYYFSIKPSKHHIQKHLFKINDIIKRNFNKNQEYIIFKLATIIKNWSFYYQIITPTILYKYLDYFTFQMLWKWACKRHYKKSKKWIKTQYFLKFDLIFKKLNNLKYHISLYPTSVKTDFYKSKKIVFASQKKSVTNLNFKNYKNNVAVSGYSAFNWEHVNRNTIPSSNSKRIFICLPNHTDVILIKHKLIQNDRSPFDGDFIYWITRTYY